MNTIKATFIRHVRYIVTYPITCLLIFISCGIIIYNSMQEKTVVHALAYIGGVWLCAFITDIVVIARPKTAVGFPIKKPVKKELWTIIICTVLGASFLVIRFFTDWEHLSNIARLLTLPLLIFTFQAAQAFIFLFVFKYKFKELGVNLNYWYLPIILHIVWGVITLLVAPEVSHWQEAYKDYGIIGSLFIGIISAALPEEFMRLLFQTRIGKATKSIAFGLFMATAIWGAMHIAIGYHQSHQPVTLWSAALTISYLVPIGLFWGYLTQRTKSLFPAVMMHGFNLWGLQNF